VGIGLAAAVVATFYRVFNEAVEGVIINLAATGGVNATLGSNGVSTAGCVVVGEGLHVVAEFTEGSGGAGTGEASANNDDL
ncbi:hypothetical protein NL351_30030, partial [Klebsiella pneumoniae]|nr:hypothetical protein [Klebsiella pneumoniae]